MREPKWLKLELAIAVHGMLLAEHGGSEGVRDRKLLESALNRARQKYSYEEHCTLFDLAGAISYGLAKNHPFVDGNKRVALTLTLAFLEINGVEVDASEAEVAATFEALAAGQLTEAEMSQWFELHGRGT